jgi:hypothetical protein
MTVQTTYRVDKNKHWHEQKREINHVLREKIIRESVETRVEFLVDDLVFPHHFVARVAHHQEVVEKEQVNNRAYPIVYLFNVCLEILLRTFSCAYVLSIQILKQYATESTQKYDHSNVVKQCEPISDCKQDDALG